MPGHMQTAGKKNGSCDWILSSEHLNKDHHTEGIFMSIAHWYPPHTSCTYHLLGLPNQVVRVYFPRYVYLLYRLFANSIFLELTAN